MSLQYGKLCYLLLTEHYGEVIGKVAENLQWGPKPLSHIVLNTGLVPSKVKKALSILIQYGFVIYERGKVPWLAEYTLLHDKILLIFRYPKYLTLIKSKCGIEAQMLLEEVFKHGNITSSSAIINVYRRVKEGGIEAENITFVSLRNGFHQLVSNHFLMRCANPSLNENENEKEIEGHEGQLVPKLTIAESELYQSPDINIKILTEFEAGRTTNDPGDKGIYWKPNFDRFNQDIRDEIMINAMRRRFDDNAAELMKFLLQLMYLRTDPWANDSNPVPILELKELVTKKSGNSYLIQYFEQYLKIMEEDSSNFISRTGDTSSSQVTVNLPKAFCQLSATAIENVVDQRYGSKASRIFRLICNKKFIEQEQIQQLAMIPDKEAKQITYKLLQENFIQMQELRKPTAGSGPNKAFFLFHVDINLVIHMVIAICHKALFNALSRRRFERNDHKRLIEKQEKIKIVIQSMREQGTEEEDLQALTDEWMSPPEKNVLESVDKMMQKLQLSEIQIDSTLFLLQLFSYYHTLNMPKVTTGKK